jgi:hypothetical protein
MKSFIAAAMASATFASENGKEFEFMMHISKYGDNFKTLEEYTARFARWLEADAFIAMINHPESGETHTAGHNKFSTWHEHEYEALLTHSKPLSAPETEP